MKIWRHNEKRKLRAMLGAHNELSPCISEYLTSLGSRYNQQIRFLCASNNFFYILTFRGVMENWGLCEQLRGDEIWVVWVTRVM